jgi:hypothetical protein
MLAELIQKQTSENLNKRNNTKAIYYEEKTSITTNKIMQTWFSNHYIQFCGTMKFEMLQDIDLYHRVHDSLESYNRYYYKQSSYFLLRQ